MDYFYERVLRPIFFKLDCELAHNLGAFGMTALGWMPPVCRVMERCGRLPAAARPIEAFGLKFPNAVGLAAGFDKHATAWPAAAALGFGHIEIGTITALAQPGNPKPRAFRYPSEEAVINRMGFNNEGAETVAKRLAKMPKRGKRRIPLGINIGKSKVTPLEKAVEDYLTSFSLLADHADYLVLNVSSPNTPDLRKLQDEQRLSELLAALDAANRDRASQKDAAGNAKTRVPLLLKIAPDLTYPQIDAVLEQLEANHFDGIIATNTTLARPGYFENIDQTGGLSGKPLTKKSTEIIRYISRATNGRLPIIGVGGIHTSGDAGEKLDAGATLVQIYTGMIYRGPFFARELARELSARQLRPTRGY
ncbi:dihydroorotate dehydrogenase [Ereboglobus sp. PH5-10]|uniref:Dihydroorotate dehydrogenase (quinone) n=1 Tax=Ereboglobus luteus TaxID=1796921 RepID=A0A2U8E2Y8_9BACT|nr:MULTISPECIES: quinone-dependent dihydroorotate dehydrogenase [Ereboglobus]AWI09155.1 dihydroorotate dehydrogenase (quinone) [Ereboglobus luteus]MDF9826284.1 dihydroorotate dehydrogenase [Ereboglobus sp. PH5-10]